MRSEKPLSITMIGDSVKILNAEIIAEREETNKFSIKKQYEKFLTVDLIMLIREMELWYRLFIQEKL